MNKQLVLLISLLMIISMLVIVTPIHADNNKNASSNQLTINPNNYYSKEPAPMGIVDYGINSSGNGYSFNSTSFTGIVNISSLKTYNASISSCPNNTGIQLNLVYSFEYAGSNYTYWVQNVAIINTSSEQIAFIDNIWNFTSENSVMHNSTVSGKGKVYTSNSGNYYGTSGNFSKLNNKIEFRSNSYLSNGYPHLYMEYNNGKGWITYDTVNFTFASKVNIDHGFIVNGNKNAGGHAIDAGLIIGGPGNGTSTKVINANLTMALEYWNGHNYQAVLDAYNHGSDTAEGVCNASVFYSTSAGIPVADIGTGNANLGILYSSSDVAVINFRANTNNSYITLNGINYNYTGNSINLTLNPGNYYLKLYSTAGQLIYQHNYTLTAGNYYPVNTKQTYSVIFTEIGLSPGTKWAVDVNGNTLSSTENNITFYLYNNSYNYSIQPISGYSIQNGTGSFILNATPEHFNITFQKIPPVIGIANHAEQYKIIISAIIVIAVISLAIVALKPGKREK